MFSNDSPQICDCLLRNFPAAGFIIPASSEQSVFRGQLPPPSFSLSLSLSPQRHNTKSRSGCLANGREGSNAQWKSFVRAQESKLLENQIHAETVC